MKAWNVTPRSGFDFRAAQVAEKLLNAEWERIGPRLEKIQANVTARVLVGDLTPAEGAEEIKRAVARIDADPAGLAGP